MKLGVCYNLFDGIELLRGSIRCIRENVDHIMILYQNISNFGNVLNSDACVILESLKEEGLIDDILVYDPIIGNGHSNELKKRQKGLDYYREKGFTHYMSIDCDEFYIKDQFKNAKDLIEREGYDSSSCQMQTYYHSSEWVLDPSETYHVPFIYKIDERNYSMGNQWSVAADPTRRLSQKKIIHFERNIIEMHHLSYVRNDIRTKLLNSSAKINFQHRIEEIASYYDAWNPSKKALLAGKEERFYDLKKASVLIDI